MTLATYITLFRLCIVPFLLFFLLQRTQLGYAYAAMLFALAVASDVIDGYIARILRQVSELGAALDPICDKILVHSTLFSLWYLGIYDPIILFAMFFRDMIVDGFRAQLNDEAVSFGANIWGKLKFAFQTISIFFALACCANPNYGLLGLAANIGLFLAFVVSLPGLWRAALKLLATPLTGHHLRSASK